MNDTIISNIESCYFATGLTVKKLKELIEFWPEEKENGELTEVWIETEPGSSSQCYGVCPLNCKSEGPKIWADLLLELK